MLKALLVRTLAYLEMTSERPKVLTQVWGAICQEHASPWKMRIALVRWGLESLV
jgi:hypothetical protein